MTLTEKARSFSRLDAWRAGRVAFEEEVLRNPREPEAHAHLGFFCVKESFFDTKRGLAEFDAALALDPGCVWAHLYRSFTLGSLQRLSEARDAIRTAERLGARPEDLTWARACVELDAGSVDEAVAQFRRLVEFEKDATSMILLSQAYSQRGHNNEALAWARKAFEADPRDFRAPTYMGVYLAYLRRYDEARAALEKAESFAVPYALLHHALAYAAREEGKTDEAERHLRKALEIDAEYVVSRKWLADLCAASGRVGEAREHYQRALMRFPDYKEAREALLRLGA
ncbi:MAG: tetratricopeptide repeat protein [Elusimicrobiota bacterium]